MERERQKQYGLIRLDSDIVEDMERERRTFQLQMCEVCVCERLFVGLRLVIIKKKKCLGHVLHVWFVEVGFLDRGNLALAALLNQDVVIN